MKNKVKILGIIAVAAIIGLSMIGCAKGGTVTVKNDTGGAISAFVGGQSSATNLSSYKAISAGSSQKWSFSDDGTYYYVWSGGSGLGIKQGSGTITVEGGASKTITAR
jgi:hypothetical protein